MSLEAARRALIERQGKGARYDAPGAPAQDLLRARRLTAGFTRLLNDAGDAELAAGGALGRQVARIALEARRMSEFIAACKGLAPGQGCEIALEVSGDEIAHCATLQSHALRHLHSHTCVHLNVEWREMSDEDWKEEHRDAAGQAVRMIELPARRAGGLAAALDALGLRGGV